MLSFPYSSFCKVILNDLRNYHEYWSFSLILIFLSDFCLTNYFFAIIFEIFFKRIMIIYVNFYILSLLINLGLTEI
jgi:hypothetical protein